MKKNKGFTLVELLAVIVLLSLIMLLIFPSIRSIYNSNQNKQYNTYKDMMVEYTKTIPNYKKKTYVCLNELGIPKINNKITCNGYVEISTMKAYLVCKNAESVVFQDDGISVPSTCQDY